jgi:hypothetical protein
MALPDDLNFGTDLEVWDDGDGTVSINSTAISPNEKGAAGGVAELDSSSKIPTTQLPSLALSETDVVADQAARLALNAEKGDVAIQQDENQSYILQGTDPTVDSEWAVLQSPTSDLTSIFGRTGDVTAQSGDYTHGQIGNVSSNDHHDRYTDSEASSAAPLQSVNGKTGDVTVQGFSGSHNDLANVSPGDHHAVFEPADYNPVSDVNAETSLSVDITGDADTLDGNHAGSFVSTSGDTMTGQLTVERSDPSYFFKFDNTTTGSAMRLRVTDGDSYAFIPTDPSSGDVWGKEFSWDVSSQEWKFADSNVKMGGDLLATQAWTNSNFNAYTFSEDHDDLTGVSSSDHHTRYADSEAVTAINSQSSLSVDISGDADTVDGYQSSELSVRSENETISGEWTFTDAPLIRDRNDYDVSPSFSYDQGSDSTTYYHEIATVSSQNGGVHVHGFAGGHTPSEGKAMVDFIMSNRDSTLDIAHYGGELGTASDFEVYEDTNGNLHLYLVTSSWSQVNLELRESGSGGNIKPNATKTSTSPSGTLVYTMSTDAEVQIDYSGNLLNHGDRVATRNWTKANADVPNADYADSAGDADTVDGEHASAFANSGHLHDNRYLLESGDSMNGNFTVNGATGGVSSLEGHKITTKDYSTDSNGNPDQYGYIQFDNTNGTRGAYLGHGNGGSIVDLKLDNAAILDVQGGELQESGNRVATRTWANNNADVPNADYADSAGDADTVDGFHADDIARGQSYASFTSTDTSTNINSGSWTAVPWDVQKNIDVPYTHDPSGSPDQITFDEAGTYKIYTSISYNSQEYRQNPGVSLEINGNVRDAKGLSGYSRHASGHKEASNSIMETISVSAGDTVRVVCKAFGNGGVSATLRNRESTLEITSITARSVETSNADTLDGYQGADFLLSGGDTMNGNLNMGDYEILNLSLQNVNNIEMDGDINGGGFDFEVTEVSKILGPSNGASSLTLETNGSGSHLIELWDGNSNSALLTANEGGPVNTSVNLEEYGNRVATRNWTNNNADVPNADYADSAGDADTLDGEHASAFANSGHLHDNRYLLESGDSIGGTLNLSNNRLENVSPIHFGDAVASAQYEIDTGSYDLTFSKNDGNGGQVDVLKLLGSSGSTVSGVNVVSGTLQESGNRVATRTWAQNTAKVNNSDLLDGEHASAFANSGHLHDSRYLLESGDTLNGILDLGNNDLEDGTTTIWDASNGYVNQSVLENTSVTVAGNSVSLGNSISITHADLSDAPNSAHHTRYADSEAVSAVNAEVSLTVDISGDADTLDGEHASAFADSGHLHDSRYIKESGDTMNGTLTLNDGSTAASQSWTNSNFNNYSDSDASSAAPIQSVNGKTGDVNIDAGNSLATNNFEVKENSSTNSLDFNYTG